MGQIDFNAWGIQTRPFAAHSAHFVLKMTHLQHGAKKIPAKFGEGSSVMAVGLCMGCPRSVGRMKGGDLNMLEFVCTTL